MVVGKVSDLAPFYFDKVTNFSISNNAFLTICKQVSSKCKSKIPYYQIIIQKPMYIMETSDLHKLYYYMLQWYVWRNVI